MTKLVVILAVLIFTGCASSNPLNPSKVNSFTVPTELLPIISFLDADPWMHPLLDGKTLGEYVRRYVVSVEMHPTLNPGVGAMAILEERRILWQPKNTIDTHGLAGLAGLLLHETRHIEMKSGHSCGAYELAGDRTMEEGGAFAVQILYLEHVGFMNEAMWFRQNYIGCK